MRSSIRTSALLLSVGAFLATQPGASCVSDTSTGGTGAQVLFFESDEECDVSYKDRGGKYQGQTGVTLPKA